MHITEQGGVANDDVIEAYGEKEICFVPLQAELLALTIQLRTSKPSILAVLHEWER